MRTAKGAPLNDGSAKCWGAGNYDRFGYGDEANRGDAPGQMGVQLPGVDLEGCSVDISAAMHLVRWATNSLA